MWVATHFFFKDSEATIILKNLCEMQNNVWHFLSKFKLNYL